MPDRDETDESLQSLPPGMPRRYAEYKPVGPGKPSPPPTNVGGYDDLLNYCRGKGLSLSRSRQGLAAIDSLIENPQGKRDLTEISRAVGMFYGDVLTHSVPGANWEVIEEGFPCVRISRNTSVSVIHVAQRRLRIGTPTLVMNYDHALDLVDQDRIQGI
jgi:hypothetical protein